MIAALVDNLPNGIIVTDLNGKIIYVNQLTEQLTGYPRDELIGRSPGMLNCENNADEIQQEIVASMQRNENWCGQILQRRKDGKIYRAELEVFPVLSDGRPIAWASIHRDLAALRESEERYRQLFNSGNDIMFVHGFENGKPGNFIEVNDVACMRLGYTRKELLELSPTEIDNPDKLFDDASVINNLYINKQVMFERVFITKEGSRFPVEINTHLFEYRGQPCVLSIARDITERKRAEKALRRAKQEKELILKTISEQVVYLDKDLRMKWVNRPAATSCKITTEQMVGRHCYEVWHQRNSQCPGCPVVRSFASGESQEGEVVTPDGKMWNLRCYPVKDEVDNTISVVEVARDITERKQIEKEMARLDRLHLIGEMAASIGHEVRNPMTTVRGFLQLLKTKQECSGFNDYFDLMIQELDRSNSIISQFLSLARNKPVDKAMLNLNSIIETLFPLLQADAFKTNIHINKELGQIPLLCLDEKEIRQLVLNLVRNGLEAMSSQGTLTLKTYIEDEYVVLAIRDQGCGIKQEIIDKLGTPFITTKDDGTGLGMAVCYSIAAKHSAKIDVETGPKGTTFFVKFKF